MKDSQKIIRIIFLLLCMIPFLGILIGVGRLLFEIFKIKSKSGILLSCFGVIIGFLSTFLFIKFLLTSKFTRPSFADISEQQLNGLVPQIEFYKLQHNSYPDSLEQLMNDSMYVPIIQDPILVWNFKHDGTKTTYIYKKIGEKYTIFSVGVDLIPNTADDIYPTVKLNPNNSGLIR